MRPDKRRDKTSSLSFATRFRYLAAVESGIVLPLAMIMVVLISVVGAGLLVFVISDNSSAAQVNRGQQAFGAADAGVAAAQSYINKNNLSEDKTVTFTIPSAVSGAASSTATVNISRSGNKYTVNSSGRSASGAERRVEAVLSAGSSRGVTAPKNYYTGTNMNLSNNFEATDGDILVEGDFNFGSANRALKLTDGSILVKGYGNFPNQKILTNGDFYIGNGATFSNTTTVNNGNIFVNGTPSSGTNTFTNDTAVSGGGIYVGGPATFSNDTRITGGDLYVQGATRVGNLNVSAGGNVLVDGNFSVDNSLRLDNSYLYVTGDARIQNATITNSRIFINGIVAGGILSNGAAEFVQTNNIRDSVIYVGGNTTFTNSGNLTGTSLFINGNINFSNSMTFGTANDTRYGNWRVMPDGNINEFNKTARGSTRTGIGATGAITGNDSATSLRGSRSYDNATNPRFVATVSNPQPLNRMRFPFDPANIQGPTLLANASSMLAAARTDAIQRIEAGRLSNTYLDELRQRAINQGNYREVTNQEQELVETVGQWRTNQRTWPENSEYTTVVYYRFPSYSTQNRVQWLIRAGCTNQDRKGILVIENGIFSSYGGTSTSPMSGFNGTVVLRNSQLEISNDFCMNGYVNAQRSFTSGNSARFNLGEVPPLSELERSTSTTRTSWRECYNTACN